MNCMNIIKLELKINELKMCYFKRKYHHNFYSLIKSLKLQVISNPFWYIGSSKYIIVFTVIISDLRLFYNILLPFSPPFNFIFYFQADIFSFISQDFFYSLLHSII